MRDVEPFIFDCAAPKEVSGVACAVIDVNSLGGVDRKEWPASELDQLARRSVEDRTERRLSRIIFIFARLVMALIANSRFNAELRLSLDSW